MLFTKKKNRNLNKKKSEASTENAEKKKRNAKKTDARYVEKKFWNKTKKKQ